MDSVGMKGEILVEVRMACGCLTHNIIKKLAQGFKNRAEKKCFQAFGRRVLQECFDLHIKYLTSNKSIH